MIVITHGTDTMVETARHVAQKVKDMTIVLTGAMVPYTFGSSDGMFNLGSALAYVQVLQPGVYIVMNGRYYDWNKVLKNKRIGEFEVRDEVAGDRRVRGSHCSATIKPGFSLG